MIMAPPNRSSRAHRTAAAIAGGSVGGHVNNLGALVPILHLQQGPVGKAIAQVTERLSANGANTVDSIVTAVAGAEGGVNHFVVLTEEVLAIRICRHFSPANGECGGRAVEGVDELREEHHSANQAGAGK